MNDGQPFDPHCIFCQIIRHEAPAEIRYESDDVIVFDDYRPRAPIHVLICPTGHYPTFLETPADVLARLNAEIKTIAERLGCAESGFRLLINNGRESGQIVYHLHYHLLAGKRMGGF